MNIGLVQLRFDILTVIIVCFVLIEVCLIIYSIFFRRIGHSAATSVSVVPILCMHIPHAHLHEQCLPKQTFHIISIAQPLNANN